MSLPCTVLEKPHCGDRQSCSSGTSFAAASMRRFRSSLPSSCSDLGADQSQHDRLVLRHVAQRREVARARVVVFEEIAVDGELVEQDFGHRLVAALRGPCALEIAAAQVHARGHAGRALRDRRVDELGVAARQLVGIVAALARAFAHLLVAQVGEIGIVELQVRAAGRREVGDLVAIRLRHVVVERLEVRIRIAADRAAAAAEMQHRRRGDRHLRRARGDRAQELEVGALDRLVVANLAGNLHHRRREIDVARRAVEADVDAALRRPHRTSWSGSRCGSRCGGTRRR